MPEASLWTLVVSLALLAFGLTLRVTHLSHALKLSHEELSAFFKKLDALKEQHQKEIAGMDERNKAQAAKFLESYGRGIDKAIEVAFRHANKPKRGALGNHP